MSAYHDKNLGKREKKLGLLLTSLVIQGLRLCLYNAGGMGWIPGWETQDPTSVRCDQKSKNYTHMQKGSFLQNSSISI